MRYLEQSVGWEKVSDPVQLGITERKQSMVSQKIVNGYTYCNYMVGKWLCGFVALQAVHNPV